MADQPNLIFLTVTCHHGERWLGNTDIQHALDGIWRHHALSWMVGYYLLMPDHLHLFCSPHEWTVEIERWISYWKFLLARRRPEAGRWQRGGFHHRLRSRIEFENKWQYVRENPIRRGLVENAEEWPYQGHIHPIGWK